MSQTKYIPIGEYKLLNSNLRPGEQYSYTYFFRQCAKWRFETQSVPNEMKICKNWNFFRNKNIKTYFHWTARMELKLFSRLRWVRRIWERNHTEYNTISKMRTILPIHKIRERIKFCTRAQANVEGFVELKIGIYVEYRPKLFGTFFKQSKLNKSRKWNSFYLQKFPTRYRLCFTTEETRPPEWMYTQNQNPPNVIDILLFSYSDSS